MEILPLVCGGGQAFVSSQGRFAQQGQCGSVAEYLYEVEHRVSMLRCQSDACQMQSGEKGGHLGASALHQDTINPIL